MDVKRRVPDTVVHLLTRHFNGVHATLDNLGDTFVLTAKQANRTNEAGSLTELPLPAALLQISLFGPLTIRRGDTELGANDLGGPKPRQVLEILLLHFGSAVSKERLMELLWEGNRPAGALATLESYVSLLRRHLQPGAGRTGPLRTVTGGYAIDRSLVDLDLDRFRTLTKMAGTAEPREGLDLLTEALDLASAPLLGEELLPAWAEEARALHAADIGETRVMAAEFALSLGKADTAISLSSAAVKEDALNERAWTTLILSLEHKGENSEALQAYDRCRRVIHKELGCAPGQALQEAQARLLANTATSIWSPDDLDPMSMSWTVEDDLVAAESTQETRRLRILIVDDHTTFSDLLAGALDREPDLKSVGAANSAASAVTMFHELQPDVVLMDLYLGDGTGLEAAGRILSEAPEARIIMLTGNPSQEALREAAGMGICGFLPKDGALGVMLDTLRHAHAGSMILNPSLVTRWGSPTASPQ
jgi:DNA-binding SARP family transcriptional activator/CheY-like chemotaxis protein